MYKHYAIIENGVVVEYPVDAHDVPGFDLPMNWPGGELNGKTYVFCHDQKPYRNWDQIEVETEPYFDQDSGLWYRGYELQPAPQSVIDDLLKNADIGAKKNVAVYLEQYSEQRANELELSQEQKASWAQFRVDVQAVFSQPGYPMSVIWPEIPDGESKQKIEVVRV